MIKMHVLGTASLKKMIKECALRAKMDTKQTEMFDTEENKNKDKNPILIL